MTKRSLALLMLAGSLSLTGCGGSSSPAAAPAGPAVSNPGATGGAVAPAPAPATQVNVTPDAPLVNGGNPPATTSGSSASSGGSGHSGGGSSLSGGSAAPAPVPPPVFNYLPNEFIVFASDRYPNEGNNDIYIYDTFQDTVLAVVGVNTYKNEFNPRISDNGKWLVFQRDQGNHGYGYYQDYGQQDILMYGLQTKLVNTLKVLNTEEFDEYMPDITNDGTKIVYVSDETGYPEIRLYDVVTGDNYVVPGANRNFADLTWPTISANGLKIAYGASIAPGYGLATDGTGNYTGGPAVTGGALYPAQSDIYVYDVVNGVQLTPPFINTAFDEYNPDLCADGSRILFVSNRLGTEDIFEVNLDTGFTDNLSFLNTYELDEQMPRYIGATIDRIVFQIKYPDSYSPVALRAFFRPAALLDTLPVANQLFADSALRAPQPEIEDVTP